MTLKELVDNFVYTPDKQEDWRVPELVDGKYRDDCDGFMLACYYEVDEFKDKDKKVWYCKVGKTGHVVTQVDDKYIDNITRELVSLEYLNDRNYNSFKRIYPIGIWFRMFASKIGLFKLLSKMK